MGRGRQKAKQKKMARKLKYLTTNTNYDELAKELGAQDSGSESADSFVEVEQEYSSDHNEAVADVDTGTADRHHDSSVVDDDLDDYAKWAAEAAAKASGDDKSSAKKVAIPKPRKPIRMPVPSILHKPKSEESAEA
jgi:poly-D-alanine transfer protein DltD